VLFSGWHFTGRKPAPARSFSNIALSAVMHVELGPCVCRQIQVLVNRGALYGMLVPVLRPYTPDCRR
jgi:hypothetical protein